MIALYKELETLNQKMFRADAGSAQMSVYKEQRAELEKLITDTQKYNEEQRKAA